MKCPECQEGYIYGFAPNGPITICCYICHGSGILPPMINYDPERGTAMKKERIVDDMSLREYCKLNSIDVVERSRMERGYFKK